MIQWINEWEFKINSEMVGMEGQLLLQINRMVWKGPFFYQIVRKCVKNNSNINGKVMGKVRKSDLKVPKSVPLQTFPKWFIAIYIWCLCNSELSAFQTVKHRRCTGMEWV